MRFEVLVFGELALATKFTRMGDDILDASPAFSDVADYLFGTTQKQFDSQGRRGGGSWKPLSRKWFIRKARHGWDTRILHKFDTLKKSVTRRGATGQILDIGDDFLLFGSSLNYAGRHQFGYNQTPARPFVKVTKQDTTKIRGMIRDHLMRAWKAQ